MTGSGSLGATNRIQPRGSAFDELTTGSSVTIRCRTRSCGEAPPPLLRTSTPRAFQIIVVSASMALLSDSGITDERSMTILTDVLASGGNDGGTTEPRE